MMKLNHDAMPLFHPLVTRWFLEQIGNPTPLQEKAWPRIAAGEHVLITAPTGSGKTFAAFLWAINQLVTGGWSPAHTSVLYVSPLRALNNDIQRNLLGPLNELKQVFEREGEAFPQIRVLTRSGDTPQSDRRRMQRHPPEILITTPESLNLLLSSVGGRFILNGISTVILDEIHAVVGNKRGVHLMTAVDRLIPLSGEFQRIALSATIQPLELVAQFVGGYRMEGNPHSPGYFPRPVSIVGSTERKDYDLQVRFPEEATVKRDKDAFWRPFVTELKKVIERNKSTLLFTNSRRLCEKLTHLINQDEVRPIAYAHHGSLSREIREEVERKLKAGDLRAIVATNSLELGIDIGTLDEVILIQSPPSVSSAIQRVGRASHQVGQVSRGTVLPTHSQDFLEAAVLASAVLTHDIESIKPLSSPLDVLAQVIVSMVGVDTWDLDALYAQLKTSYPYRFLSREQFDLVLHMLAGRYEHSRIRELKPRVSIDRIDNSVRARKGALQALYVSGGTIPDRGYFHLRHAETNGKIGDLDEEFVWEAKVGQIFTLGAQNWKIERITHNEVFVLPGHPKTTAPPFWKGEEIARDFHFSERIGQFLALANDHLDDPDFKGYLARTHHMEKTAAKQLLAFLMNQREANGSPLPHRHHLLVEFVRAGPGGYPGYQVVLHTLWGGRVNRPFAMALEAAWEERFGHRLQVHVSNDCIILQLPHDVDSEEVLSLVKSSNAIDLLKKKLEGSGFFGARFRECAGRALLLPRRKFGERMPLWLSRLRSQKLLDAVLHYEDFPILLEAWRTCLQDEFDLDALLQVLSELESGSITWSEVHSNVPSPMAQGMTWGQINEYMYRDDEMRWGKTSMLRGDLLRDLVFAPEMRPAISQKLLEQFELKRQRLSTGYSPETSEELLDWVKERLLLPSSEWENLIRTVKSDHAIDPEPLLKPIAGKLVRIHPHGASEPLILALEMLDRIIYGLYGETHTVRVELLDFSQPPLKPLPEKAPESEMDRDEVFNALVADWLQFYGPRTITFIRKTLGLDRDILQSTLKDLIDSQRLVTGQLIKDSSEDYICDSENLEVLLRMMRAEAIPAFDPLPIECLPLFLARFQGIVDPQDHMDALFQRIEQLVCYPAQAALWESELLPARLQRYEPPWLDTLMQQTDLQWIGTPNRRICFYFEPDLDLMQDEGIHRDETHAVPLKQVAPELSQVFQDAMARYDFPTLLRASSLRSGELAEKLWEATWQGKVTNDTFMSLRQGIQTGFQVTEMAARILRTKPRRRRAGSRTKFSQWKNTLPFAGNWLLIPRPSHGEDLMDVEERNKDRARLLLDRYGILFRELLQYEFPAFRWPRIFRALRLMELSGEVLTGYFFHGLPGPQFISHEAFRMLQRKLPEEAVYWVSATDPASLCGIPLHALKGVFPRRLVGTHLVYRGKVLVLVSQRNGRALTFYAPPVDPHLQAYLGVMHHLLRREFQPLRRIVIETINDEAAASSPYLDALRTSFEVVVEHKRVILYRKEV